VPPVAPVSVVVPTRDRAEMVRALVESIYAGAQLPAQIVIADQSREPVELPPPPDGVELVHLRVPTVGLSRNRNAGIGAATRDLLVFTDDDSLVEPDWIEQLSGAIASSPPRTVVTGAVRSGAADGVAPSLTTRTERAVFTGRITGGDPLFPNNMAIPRSAFDEIGLFDERLGAGAPWFPAAEDNDFGFRLLEAGYRIEFVPTAVIRHVGARHGRELLALEWAYGRGQGAFYAKHMRWNDRHMLHRLWLNIAERLARLPAAIRGDRAAIREGAYLAGLVAGAVAWRLRYPRVLTRRRAPRGPEAPT
jgi:GT2 family glycosyltransferase